MESKNKKTSQSTGNILIAKTANEWIEIGKKMPNPKPLIGSIVHEGEVAILFANTGKGKSILGFQIAESIASGKPILGLETTKHQVLYFDFEFSPKTLERRYTNLENNLSYKFSDELIRVEISRENSLETEKASFEELLIISIKEQVENHKSEVIIIDNITYISATNERSKEALALMKVILELSRKRGIAILLIAHTPKRDLYSPLQLEDLAGSKALSNFADAVFSIGESVKGSNIRYIKELKNRNHPIVYDENNVLTCKVEKEDNFLRFEPIGTNSELEHLERVQNKGNDLLETVKELKEQGLTNVAIADRIGKSEGTVRRYIKQIEEE